MPYKDINKRREYGRVWAANKHLVSPTNYDSELRRKKRQVIDKIKESNPCHDCHNYFPAVCMDFDHLADKTSNVSRAVTDKWSDERIMNEIAKCELVCANCHRIRTQTRGSGTAPVSKTVTP